MWRVQELLIKAYILLGLRNNKFNFRITLGTIFLLPQPGPTYLPHSKRMNNYESFIRYLSPYLSPPSLTNLAAEAA